MGIVGEINMKVYVIDNGGQWTHREWRVLKYLGVETKMIPNTTPLKELDLDGLVLSGGAPRIGLSSDKMGNNKEYLQEAGFPMLGICAGHQFMAMVFGGKAAPSEVPEFGKAELFVDDQNSLFRGLPNKFNVWESHNDEVVELPKDFKILAHSKDCKVQAMRHNSRPLFGLQFHPEVENTEHGEEIFKNFLEECKR